LKCRDPDKYIKYESAILLYRYPKRPIPVILYRFQAVPYVP
jgi:hypothetical protein